MANGKEFSAGTSRLKISSFDNKAGVKEIYYSINNVEYILYDKPLIMSGYKGQMSVKSFAVDNVGNKSDATVNNSHKNAMSYVDLGAPWVGHSFKGPVFSARDTLYISNRTLINLEAKDNESGIQKIEYQLDSSELKQYSEPLRLATEGNHNIVMYGYDNIDNMTKQDFQVIVDTTGPAIYERFSTMPLGATETDGVNIINYPPYVVLFLSATDIRSGYESLSFSINNSAYMPYLHEIKPILIPPLNLINVRATDKLGNKTEKEIKFLIK